MHDRILAQIDALQKKGYSKDKIFFILSEEYEDKGTIRLIIDNTIADKSNLQKDSKQRKMITIALSVIFLKIVWNVTGDYGVGHEIHLTTIFVFWGMYDAIKKNRYENLAISVWAFFSVELLNFRYKPDNEIIYLIILAIMAILMTLLTFKWKKDKKKYTYKNDIQVANRPEDNK